MFDFVIGFSSDLLNPTQAIPYIHQALIAILLTGLDPWDAVVQYCTLNTMALTHTPIIVIDREDGKA